MLIFQNIIKIIATIRIYIYILLYRTSHLLKSFARSRWGSVCFLVMARDPDFVLKYLTEVEEKAEAVLADKQQIVDLDKKRNMNREALRAIKNGLAAPNTRRTWLNFGGLFLKVDSSVATTMLNSDQEALDEEITKLRKDLHHKVNDLRDAEGKSDLKGFDLNALSKEETKALRSSKLL